MLVRATSASPLNKRSLYAERDLVKLWKPLEPQPGAGRFAGEIPARHGTTPAPPRAPRGATVELRGVALTLHPPTRLSATLPALARSAIDVRAQAPPAAGPPLAGRLLTTLTRETFAPASETVQGYGLRWRIAMSHTVLKSGFHLAPCRPGAAQRLSRCVTVMSSSAWRLCRLTLSARTHPAAPGPTRLTEHEGQVLYGKIQRTLARPPQPPSLREAVLWLARRGGFLARKTDGQPGTLPLWRGWKRLTDLPQGGLLAAGGETCG